MMEHSEEYRQQLTPTIIEMHVSSVILRYLVLFSEWSSKNYHFKMNGPKMKKKKKKCFNYDVKYRVCPKLSVWPNGLGHHLSCERVLFVWCLTAHQHKKAICAKNR